MQALLPPEVLELLLRPRRRLVADPGPTAAGVVTTRVELHTAANADDLAAAGLTPLAEPARTATDVAFRWLSSYPSTETRRSYATDLRHFAHWCATSGGVRDVLTARRAVLQAYADHMASKVEEVLPDGKRTVRRPALSPRTRQRRLAALASFFNYALDEELVTTNPAARLKRPTVTDADRNLTGLSRPQLVSLLDAAKAYGTREHALVCLLALLGLRVSEAVNIDVEHLGERSTHNEDADTDVTHHVITLIGKGGKPRTLAMGPRTLAAVTAARGGRDAGPLLLTGTGTRMSAVQARRTIKILAGRAGLAGVGARTPRGNPGLHPHTLRHTFVTLARRAGASLEDVQDAVGHSDPRTTRAYDREQGRLDSSPSYDLEGFLARSPRVRPGHALDAPPSGDDTPGSARRPQPDYR